MIKEDLLHFIWKSHLVPKHDLKTTDNRIVDILNTGTLNHDNGPDFLMSRVRINGFLWAGNVEMHLKSSDWYAHGHQHDERYDNVVLHVVYEHDKEVSNKGGVIPCVELKNYINPDLIRNYLSLQQSHTDIPCFKYELTDFQEHFSWMRDRLLAERLSRKVNVFLQSNFSDPHVFRQLLLEAFGGRKNKESFQHLGKSVNWAQLERWANRPEWITAYIFKISGLFEEELTGDLAEKQIDAYVQNPMTKQNWNTRGIRPANQPKARIRQLIQLLTEGILMHLPSSDNPTDFSLLWAEEAQRMKQDLLFSDFLIENIALNTVIPYAFYQGVKTADFDWIDFAFEHLEQWKPERNAIILKFRDKGIKPITASDSQAILELHRYYCTTKKCVSCSVGNKLMRA